MAFLSFNEQHNPKADFKLPDDTDEVIMRSLREPMNLKDNWVLWEQAAVEGKNQYADATRKVTKFNTLQDFWSIWNCLPQPSELLEQKRIMRDQNGGKAVAIDALMIFKEGVAPEWEHPANNNGGHFQIQLKPSVGGGQIDEYWNNIVLGVVGGTLEPTELITGIRLVDKLSGPKVSTAIRIELWYTRQQDTTAVNTLKKNFEKCMCTRTDGSSHGSAPSIDVKLHGGMGKH